MVLPKAKTCPFCKIINNETKYSETIVYQDKKITAFMDLVQPHEGHVLVIPNLHYKNIFEIDSETAGHLFKIVVKIAKAVKKTFRIDGINIYQCNGKHAAQMINHFHVHIFPRKKDDGLFLIYPDKNMINRRRFEELVCLRNELIKNL